MTAYTGRDKLQWSVLPRFSRKIGLHCPEDYFTLIMRRFMMEIASRIAAENECGALITGESLGQVASQTMKALAWHRRCLGTAGAPSGHRDGQGGNRRDCPQNRHL